MISDARLIGLFTGSGRTYLLVLDDGSRHWFRARGWRDARKIAQEYAGRLGQKVVLIAHGHPHKVDPR